MGKKIMLVDDAAFMRMTIKNTLTKAGYTELIEAGDGQQAVDTYGKEHPYLVIMDIIPIYGHPRPGHYGYHHAQHGWHPGPPGH